MTFAECAQAYYDFHADKWKSKKWTSAFQNTLRDYAMPKIGHLPVAAIDVGLVLRCVEPIWKTKTPTASRVRARIENVLDWATSRGYRNRENPNPARWGGHLEHQLPAPKQLQKVDHHAALPYAEAPAFMERLRAIEGLPARALELTVLNATRTMETLAARWEEIDLENKTLTVPQARTKNRERDHVIPLSARALEILQGLPRTNAFVFPGTRSANKHISHNAMDRLLKTMGYVSDKASVHGFRSCFRDWVGEVTAYPNEVAEMALGHTIKNKAEAAYRRGDLFIKRQRLISDWAKFCQSKPVSAADVTPLRKKA